MFIQQQKKWSIKMLKLTLVLLCVVLTCEAHAVQVIHRSNSSRDTQATNELNQREEQQELLRRQVQMQQQQLQIQQEMLNLQKQQKEYGYGRY